MHTSTFDVNVSFYNLYANTLYGENVHCAEENKPSGKSYKWCMSQVANQQTAIHSVNFTLAKTFTGPPEDGRF